jgi:ribosomal protein S18 acetylase RimI-like enzyme
MYSVRQLTVEDRASFRELRQIALTVNPDDFLCTGAEERAIARLNIEEALERPDDRNLFLGAFAGDPASLVGVAGLVTGGLRKIRHAGHLTSLFVHPAHRRRRIARMLIERLLAQAASAGMEAVRLEVVAENIHAIQLYESLGFVRYGCEPAAYRMGERAWDLLLMTRNCRARV